MNYKAVIFDLDGTLLDSLPDIAITMNRVLKRLGYPLYTPEDYKYLVGEGIKEMVKRALPMEHMHEFIDETGNDQKLDALVDEYRGIYALQWRENSRPYSGVPEMLDELVKRGIKFGVLSNKLDQFTREMVTVLLPRWNFSVVFGTRPGVPLKPHPQAALEMAHIMGISHDETIFVGDSGIDMQTAVNAQMLPIGVLWGLREKQELILKGAQHLIHHPMELTTFL